MPYARSGSLRVYYESTGRGPAVLLVLGQGSSLESGWRTVERLSASFRVLTFDHRDVGRTDRSPWPYLVMQMAGDAIAVLDAAQEPRAHLYGISLGGMVAQEIALRHPDRIGALVLGSTTPGGPLAIPRDPQALTFFARAGAMGREEAEWAAVPYSYGERTRRNHGERIAEDITRRLSRASSTLAYVPETFAYLHQVSAAATHITFNRLSQIAAPTLVVHGAQDRIQSPENARILANSIRGAELNIWPEAGHVYVTDEPQADHEIAAFLERHASALGHGDTHGDHATASRVRTPEP
jgi:pimeloyl-ACP methyl ester carboxylesterase